MSAIRVAGKPEVVQCSNSRLTLLIPIQIRRRGGGKKITLPNGKTGMPKEPSRPTAMQQALARGHRWLAMLWTGEVKTLLEQAIHKEVNNNYSYVSGMINLTMLSHYVVAAILDDRLSNHITLMKNWQRIRR